MKESSRPALIGLLALFLFLRPAHAQTFQVLHTFHGPDGALPLGVLLLDDDGNVYGTTNVGGAAATAVGGICGKSRCGSVFMLNRAGKEIGLYSFSGGNGYQPSAGLLRDAAGNLYGTTLLGGNVGCYELGCGTVFKLGSTGKEDVLYEFKGDLDGFFSEALLVSDPEDNLYGTTSEGGGAPAYGTVFRIDPEGGETILHSFSGPPTGGGDGAYSYAGVIRDAAGNLYGVTDAGGASGAGTVYRLDTSGNEVLLYSFTGATDGGGPFSVLLSDSEGNLYGTTQYGGNLACEGGDGCGVVFELSPQPSGAWKEATLYTFCSLPNCTDGERPAAGPLVRDAAGNLYGTTYFGGDYGDGVVFELDTTGEESVLHSFTGGSDGFGPFAGLAIDAAGNLYGTTELGGDLSCAQDKQGCGVVFKLTP